MNEFENKKHQRYNTDLHVFQSCELFKGLEKEQLSEFLTNTQPKLCLYKKNDIIVNPREKLVGIGVVISGKIMVSKESSQGANNIIAIVGSGGIFGEIAAFAKKGAPSTVSANSDCCVAFVEIRTLIKYSKNRDIQERLMFNLLSAVTSRALVLSQKLDYLGIRNLRARLCTYLCDSYVYRDSKIFMLKLNRAQLADYLGVSRPSLSREMAWLRKGGCIEFHGSSVKINDIEKLMSYTDT